MQASRSAEATVALQINRVDDLAVAIQRPPTNEGKPPVLLIHGMFGGAWYWEDYQNLLARHGYESHAINLRDIMAAVRFAILARCL